MDQDKHTACLVDMQSKLDRICISVESLQSKQQEMYDHISKIKEAVYNPDQGLYARIRELEGWKSTSSRMIWTLFTTIIGIIAAFAITKI